MPRLKLPLPGGFIAQDVPCVLPCGLGGGGTMLGCKPGVLTLLTAESVYGTAGAFYPSFRPARKPATALPPFQVSWDRRL